MKIGALRAIARNVADSLGSGIGMLIGVYDINVFGEAKRSPGGVISIDFLAPKATRGKVSPALAGAITKYRKALPSLCAKHGTSIEDFKTLTANYSAGALNRRIVVRIRDRIGRCCVDEYVGTPARHVKVTDRMGESGQSAEVPGRSRSLDRSPGPLRRRGQPAARCGRSRM